MTTRALDFTMGAVSSIVRLIHIGSVPFRPSPRTERYLALLSGLIIITVTCRVWWSLQVFTTDLGLWSGPNDPYLLAFRPSAAWLWQHDPYGVAILVWALVGIAALGPFTPATWHTRVWPMIVWGIITLASCGMYVFVGLDLMLMPLGRLG